MVVLAFVAAALGLWAVAGVALVVILNRQGWDEE